MEILGTGFIARHLSEAFGDRYPEVTAIAAGVSGTGVSGTGGKTDAEVTANFDREASLVYDVIRKCEAAGRTVIFFSTASHAMYGGEDSFGVEDGPVYPPLVYGRHKLSLEAVLNASNVDWLALRLAHVVGNGQPPHLMWPALTAQVLSGKVTLYRDARRDLLDVRDMIRAIDGILASGIRRQVVNVASGVQHRVEQVVDGIEVRLGLEAERTIVDMPAARVMVSTAKLRSLVPDWESVDFGQQYLTTLLDRYVDFYAAQGYGRFVSAPPHGAPATLAARTENGR